VIEVLRALVEYYSEHPGSMPSDFAARELEGSAVVQAAVTYVAGMTDRFAFETAGELLGWDPDRLPRGIGRGA
jgi:dGTPase